MSLVTFRGEGDAALLAFKYKNNAYNRRIYLQRNVRQVLESLTMGKALSSLRSPRPRPEPVASDDEDDDDPRPAKRRRFNYNDENSRVSLNGNEFGFRRPLGQVTNEGSRSLVRLTGKPGLLQPSDFYGKPRPVTPTQKLEGALSRSSKTHIDSILNKTPTQFKQSLRVDIVEISPASFETEKFANLHPKRSPIDIRCRMSIMIFYAKNDERPGDVSSKDYAEVCRSTKFCTLRISFGEDDMVLRRFIMSEPFIFQSHQFHVNRRLRKPNGQWSPFKFDFADKYNLQVLVEPVGSHQDWPPVDIPRAEELRSIEDGPASPISDALDKSLLTYDELHFFCKTEARLDALLDPERQNRLLDLQLQNSNRTARQVLPYTLKLEIKWALPSHLCSQTLPMRIPKAQEPSHALLPPPPTTNILDSPVRRLREDMSASNSPADRSQRRRSNVPTYNLKALSAQAQGKSPRVRRSLMKDFRSEQRGSGDDEVSVTYSLGKGDSAETGVKQTTVISGLDCPFCNSHYSQVDDLRLHLHTDHTMFKFHLRKGSPPRITFFVEVCKSRNGLMTNTERQKTYQFGQPISLYDLEKNLGGDETWAKGRHGPLHNTWPEHLLDRHDSSLSSSPHESRHSSPNTSNDTDDLTEFESSHSKVPVRPRKVFYVPKTAKPLYDTITKRILQPGEELPNSDDEKDEGWLRQKSRDLINDFTDVTLEEKDFINTYNPFIINEQLTSPRYLPDALIRFAESHRSWFAERRSRKMEFVKLMEVFILRGVVEEKTLERCIDILRVAERAKKGKDIEMDDAAPPKARALMDCICGERVQLPNRVICQGSKCPGRFFHPKCAEEEFGRPTTGVWKCNHCLS